MRSILTFLLCLLISQNCFSQKIRILHTNDLHSFFKGSFSKKSGRVVRLGGYDRLSSKISSLREEAKRKGFTPILVDAGDFYSGTIYHILGMQPSLLIFPEYEFFNYLKYDAITLGNHEFDGKDVGFKLLMKKVKQLGNQVPIISSNLILKSEFRFPIISSLVKNYKTSNGDVKIGFLGALGPDGCSVSSGNREAFRFVGHDDLKRKDKWRDLIELLNEKSKSLKEDGADMVILLLHGGGEEDERLAREVKGLDVIIAGHTHDEYFKQVKDVFVAQAGSYGRYVGQIDLEQKSTKNWKLVKERRHQIDEGFNGDNLLSDRVEVYDRFLKNYFKKDQSFGFFENNMSNKVFDRDYLKWDENGIGSFVCNKVLNGINQEVSKKLDVYLSVEGLIRTNVYSNVRYDLKDLFSIIPLGFHKDFRPGHQSVSFYLKKSDFKNLITFLHIYAKYKRKATPAHNKSLSYSERSLGIPFINKFYNFKINNRPLPELIHVGTNSFLYSYVDMISKKTFGLIDISPVDEKGNPVDSPTFHNSEVSYFLKAALR